MVIGRVVKGGAAERSGQLHPGDEVLEVNGLRLKGKSVHDICDRLCQMTGTLTFVIVPKESKRAKSLESNESSRPETVVNKNMLIEYFPIFVFSISKKLIKCSNNNNIFESFVRYQF